MNNLKIVIMFKTKDGITHRYPNRYNHIDGVEETILTAEIIDKIKQSDFPEPVIQEMAERTTEVDEFKELQQLYLRAFDLGAIEHDRCLRLQEENEQLRIELKKLQNKLGE